MNLSKRQKKNYCLENNTFQWLFATETRLRLIKLALKRFSYLRCVMVAWSWACVSEAVNGYLLTYIMRTEVTVCHELYRAVVIHELLSVLPLTKALFPHYLEHCAPPSAHTHFKKRPLCCRQGDFVSIKYSLLDVNVRVWNGVEFITIEKWLFAKIWQILSMWSQPL